MRILNALSRLLLNLPYMVRLGIVVLLFLICVILLVFGFPSPYDGSLFAVPVALAAWLFKQRGAFLCIGGTLVVIAVTYQVRANGLGPQSLFTVLIIGTVALMTEGLVIAYLRHALDLVQAAQSNAQQAQQAQQQADIAEARAAQSEAEARAAKAEARVVRAETEEARAKTQGTQPNPNIAPVDPETKEALRKQIEQAVAEKKEFASLLKELLGQWRRK